MHRYWTRRIAEHLRSRGYAVSEEAPVGQGRTVDLVATRGARRIAVEVETGKSDAAANVGKCLEVGMDRVIVVTTDSAARDRVLAALPDDRRLLVVTARKAVSPSGAVDCISGARQAAGSDRADNQKAGPTVRSGASHHRNGLQS